MSGGMDISYMTRTYAGFLKGSAMRQKGRMGQGRLQGEFGSVAERIAQSAALADGGVSGSHKAGLSGNGTKETESEPYVRPFIRDMTLEEYKQYIYDKISQIPMDASQAGWNWHIDITEAGFAAMKKDPDYEAHVLDSVRRNFSATDPFHSKNFSILHFGATEAESYGQGYCYDSPAEHLKDREESFWEKRMARRKKQQELLEELAEKKAEARKHGLPDPTLSDICSLLELLCADA